jgi:RNA polymerase sigma-70 factor (ECF subfamily)
MSLLGRVRAASAPLSAAAADPDAGRLRSIVDDDIAFRAWYDRSAPRVFSYLMARLGSSALAEELTQAVFVEAVRRPGTFDGREDAVPWLIGIARHRLARHFRDHARLNRWATEAVVRPIDAVAPDDVVWQAADLRGRIRFALDRLPTLQRAALILRYMDDLPVRQVGRRLGRSEAATESLLRRARERFEREYRGADDAD